MKLTPFAKILITLVVLGAVGAGVYSQRDKLFPKKAPQETKVVPKTPDFSGSATATAPTTISAKPG